MRSGEVAAGTVIVVRFEGPKGGPGMQEMLYPSTYLKSVGLDRSCALIEEGDEVRIDIPRREISLLVDETVLEARRGGRAPVGGGLWQPEARQRPVSRALQLYARSVASAAKGAVRTLDFGPGSA
ncbi:MAG: dihydroxy-acid dehydratase [Kiloniellales bacterium]|nr:dihydroxy-acid dehydratase [Kiloniellales bacterium]